MAAQYARVFAVSSASENRSVIVQVLAPSQQKVTLTAYSDVERLDVN